MKRVAFKLLPIVAAVLLVSCGGSENTSTSENETRRVTILSNDNSDSRGWRNPDKMTGPPMTSDQRRMKEGRFEGWKPGYATEDTMNPNPPRDTRKKALAAPGQPGATMAMGETGQVAPALPSIPTDANTKGTWSAVYNWPLIPIHMAMLPDGRLLSFGTNSGGRQTGKHIYDVYDPTVGLTNGHMTLPKETLADIFCSAALFLPITNQLLTVGGDNLMPDGFTNNTGNNETTLFTPSTNTMVAGNNMNRARWYATTTTLLNGETFINGGLGGADRPELRTAAGIFSLLSGANTTNLDYWYPRNFVAPDGRIFGYDSYGNYYYINTAGTGTLQIINQWNVDHFGESGTAVMYRPGKILQLAGYSNTASIIDITTGVPTKTLTQSLSSRRQNASATILVDGKVLTTGGSEVYNELVGVNNTAEIWNPETGTWTIGSAGALPRLYHSIGMLMTDGTVLVGGGGAWGPLNNTNVEFYYPPYLFNANGTLAERPVVTAAPTAISIGQPFSLTVNDGNAPVTRVTMIKSGATTHNYNMDQNFNELTFTRIGNTLSVNTPNAGWMATPGYYMIFALTANGTPSLARIVKIDPVTTPVPPVLPAAPTALNGTYSVTTGVSLTWTQATGTGITQNVISRSSSAAGPFTTLATVSARTSYVDVNTAPGTWYYQVKAVNAGGTGAASNTYTVTITAPPAPPVVTVNAPTKLTGYTCGAGCWTTDTGIKINWTQSNSANIATNTIWRSTTGNTGVFTILAVIPKNTTFTDKQVTSGKTYHYRITATNTNGYTSVPGNATGIASNVTINVAPPPAPPVFGIESQGETKFLVMNWWRGPPAVEGDNRLPGSCTGVPPAGNCVLGARKTFRPQGFYLQNGMVWLEVPQYEGTVNTFDHYALPVELTKNGCKFTVRHVRTHGTLEFPLNPPGLEILPHSFSMTQSLCDTFNPLSPTWLVSLNAALDVYLGADPAPYTPPVYPYNDPLTGKDPSQP